VRGREKSEFRVRVASVAAAGEEAPDQEHGEEAADERDDPFGDR
jgi:hypothetical protein